MDYIATFGSTHKVLKAEKVLKERDIPFRLIPTPKTIASFCDLSILFQEEAKEAVLKTLHDKGVKISSLYKKEGDEYVKV